MSGSQDKERLDCAIEKLLRDLNVTHTPTEKLQLAQALDILVNILALGSVA